MLDSELVLILVESHIFDLFAFISPPDTPLRDEDHLTFERRSWG